MMIYSVVPTKAINSPFLQKENKPFIKLEIMNKLKPILRWLQRNKTDITFKNEAEELLTSTYETTVKEIEKSIFERAIARYARIPRLDESIESRLPKVGAECELIILVTEFNFHLEDSTSFQVRSKKMSARYEFFANDDYSTFILERFETVEKGFVIATARRIEYGLIEITKCIQDRGIGDSDGFGVEPDTWIKAYANLRGKLISPFALNSSQTNNNINNWFEMKISPIDEAGQIKLCPYDKVSHVYRFEDYFIAEKDENCGLIDRKLQVVIPIQYKMIFIEANGLVWVKLQNNLCGILNFENNFVIPPIYSYLSYIDKGEYKGFYNVEINGESKIIDESNLIIN